MYHVCVASVIDQHVSLTRPQFLHQVAALANLTPTTDRQDIFLDARTNTPRLHIDPRVIGTAGTAAAATNSTAVRLPPTAMTTPSGGVGVGVSGMSSPRARFLERDEVPSGSSDVKAAAVRVAAAVAAGTRL